MENLDKLQKEEYESVQKAYKRGDGYSYDSDRFERYFYYLEKFGLLDVNLSVLDAGCGPCPLEKYLEEYGFEDVNAFDFSEQGIKICEENHSQFSYKVENIYNIDKIYDERGFDIVFCLQVIEHLPKHKEILKSLNNITNKALIISVPFGNSKSNRRHINQYWPKTFEEISREIKIEEPVVLERFGEEDLQLLSIWKK